MTESPSTQRSSSRPTSLANDRAVGLREFQQLIESIYFEKDKDRGLLGTYMWFAEELGELTRALRRDDHENLEEEFADVLAWLCSLASIRGVNMEQAVRRKYGRGCPYCEHVPCSCG